MKSIQINSSYMSEFLRACELLSLDAEEVKGLRKQGIMLFRVSKPGLSQNDIFKLCLYYSQFFEEKQLQK